MAVKATGYMMLRRKTGTFISTKWYALHTPHTNRSILFSL